MRFQSHTFSSLLFLIWLCRLAEVDDFISNLWNVHQAVKKQGYVQVPPTIRYVFRSVHVRVLSKRKGALFGYLSFGLHDP